MNNIIAFSFLSPKDVVLQIAERVKAGRLKLNSPQEDLYTVEYSLHISYDNEYCVEKTLCLMPYPNIFSKFAFSKTKSKRLRV